MTRIQAYSIFMILQVQGKNSISSAALVMDLDTRRSWQDIKLSNEQDDMTYLSQNVVGVGFEMEDWV